MKIRFEGAGSVRVGLLKTVAAVLAVIGLTCATSGEPKAVSAGVLVLVLLAVMTASHPEILED